MKEECEYCGSGRTVPVLDERLTGQPHGGNPYRTLCLGCDRWLTMATKEAFKRHTHPHVLPRDADPEGDDPTIPLEDWEDGRDEWSDVLDRLENYRDRDRPYEVVTDGQGDGQGGGEEDAVNLFDCPNCGEEVRGKPDECPHCEVAYNW